MPPPVVFGHVAQRGVDPTLCGYRVRAGWEEFRYAGCFEAGFCETDRCPESCTACADDDGIVVVVDDGVFEGGCCGACRGCGSSSLGLA